jgi:hypothetical protein
VSREQPSARARAGVALATGVLVATFVFLLYARQTAAVVSDWDATWFGARALLGGSSPYAAIRRPPWPWGLNYPLPAVLYSALLAPLPLPLARAFFVGLGTAVFTFVFTGYGWWTLYFLISGAMLWSWIPVQWGWLLVAKPTMGFALFAAFPRRSTVLWGAAVIALSFAIWPAWVSEWLHSVATDAPHLPHLLRPGGFLLLLALLRWRRPEGRLLAALCIIPQTTGLYETLPVALVVRDRRQAAVYATLTMIAHLLFKLGPQGPWPTGAEYQWWVMLLLVYLPALALVLKRPNGPATLDWPYPAAEPGA